MCAQASEPVWNGVWSFLMSLQYCVFEAFHETTWRDFLCLFFLAAPGKAIMRRLTLFDDRQWCWRLVQSFWQHFVIPMLQEGHDVRSMAKRRTQWLQWLWVDRVGGIKSLQNFTSLMQMMKLKGSGLHSRKFRWVESWEMHGICFTLAAQELK